MNREDWEIFCAEDPDAELFKTTGIRAKAIDNKILDTLRKDFLALEKEMETKKIEQVKVPNDPWGTPYFYIEPWYGGVKAPTKFKTFGADGEEGGEGENVDIGNWQIKYIDHIRKL